MQTIWLDLSRPLDDLRAELQGKWHNALVQGENADLTVIDDPDCTRLPWLIEQHTEHMELGGYLSASGALLEALHRHSNPTTRLHLLVAESAGEPVSGVLLARHGNTATFLVGWTGSKGRDLRATHLLLWQAVEKLKTSGIAWFDLGGDQCQSTRRGAVQTRTGWRRNNPGGRVSLASVQHKTQRDDPNPESSSSGASGSSRPAGQ